MENNLIQNIDEVLKVEIPCRHSLFQLKYYIIGKEPTHQARMWQCLRELKARRESLSALGVEIEECKDKLELLNMDLHEYESIELTQDLPFEYDYEEDFRDRRHAIRGRQLHRKIQAAKANLLQLEDKQKWLLQEAHFFYESFKNLEKVEPIKDFDDLDAQKQYWGEKLAQKINLKMLLQQPLDIEMTETIIALPDDVPVKKQMINRLNNIQNQLLELKQEYKKKLGAA
jgi:hypothetical protein